MNKTTRPFNRRLLTYPSNPRFYAHLWFQAKLFAYSNLTISQRVPNTLQDYEPMSRRFILDQQLTGWQLTLQFHTAPLMLDYAYRLTGSRIIIYDTYPSSDQDEPIIDGTPGFLRYKDNSIILTSKGYQP